MVARFINLEGGRITTFPRPQLLPPRCPSFPDRGFFLRIASVRFELLICSTLSSCALRHSPVL